jgi:hypothetical protein
MELLEERSLPYLGSGPDAIRTTFDKSLLKKGASLGRHRDTAVLPRERSGRSSSDDAFTMCRQTGAKLRKLRY